MLHTARPYQLAISELGPQRPRAPRSSLRHPSGAPHVGKTALGIRGANFSSEPHSLAIRRKQANAVAYFIARGESDAPPSLRWGKDEPRLIAAIGVLGARYMRRFDPFGRI